MINTIIRILVAYPIASALWLARRIKWAFQNEIEEPEYQEEDRTFDRRTMSDKEAIVKAVDGSNFKTILDYSLQKNNIEHLELMDTLTEEFIGRSLEKEWSSSNYEQT